MTAYHGTGYIATYILKKKEDILIFDTRKNIILFDEFRFTVFFDL